MSDGEREREGRGGRVLCKHKSTCHKPSSQPALETEPNQQLAPRVTSEPRQPVTAARGRPLLRRDGRTKVTGYTGLFISHSALGWRRVEEEELEEKGRAARDMGRRGE